MKLAIVGSRDYADLDSVARFVGSLPLETEILTGGARGVDSIVESEARKRGLQITVYRAEWRLHGRRAGPIRNQRLAEACDQLVAFWDGGSAGTGDAIRRAQALGKTTHVHRICEPVYVGPEDQYFEETCTLCGGAGCGACDRGVTLRKRD